jgi:hypothetical protein
MDSDRRSSGSSISFVATGVQLEDYNKTSTDSSSSNSLSKASSRARSDVEGFGTEPVVANMEEMALKALHVDDDPTLNPWTFRMFILGIISCAGGILDAPIPN